MFHHFQPTLHFKFGQIPIMSIVFIYCFQHVAELVQIPDTTQLFRMCDFIRPGPVKLEDLMQLCCFQC